MYRIIARTACPSLSRAAAAGPATTCKRSINMAAMVDKREGDISDAFASLSGIKDQPLPDEFRQLKLSLVQGREDKIKASWTRLLEALRTENDIVAQRGPSVIPEIRFDHLQQDLDLFKNEIKKRGAVVIRGMIPEDDARGYKFELEEYIRKNPQTKGTAAVCLCT